MFIEDKKDKVFIPQTQNTITANDYNQIKNEIQHAIELAGMTPEKDVIQLPQALKTLTQQSGAEEVAKIEAAGQEQTSSINSTGATQVQAVNAAGEAQKMLVENTGMTQISEVQAAGERTVSLVEQAGADAAQLAKDWAIKTDGPVASGEYSAKKYAQDAAQSATAINPDTYVKKAGDTMSGALKIPTADLAADDTTAVNREWVAKKEQTRISNCLTKIPQDIKLILNSNGSITLKAGSVVYDGSGNKINITSDLTSSSGYTGILFTNASGTSLFTNKLNAVRSGGTEPEEIGIWYDTINKVVKFKGASSSSYSGEYSLPIALVSAGSSTTAAYSAIDQVFNGFGFIGNVAFVLPGVECLRASGRKDDGSLNSALTVISQLIIPTLIDDKNRTQIYITSTTSAFAVTDTAYEYNLKDNTFINVSDGSTRAVCFAFSVTRDDTGRILSLTPQDVFRAVDYGDVYKRTTVYSSDGSNATITFPTPIKVKDARYLEVVYTAKGKSYTSVIPSVFAPLGIVVGSLNWGGDQTDRDYDCVMNVTCADGYITAFTSSGRDIYIKRVDVVDYLARS